MAKKAEYFDTAERLYVVEQRTLAEIAAETGVAESTLRLWKRQGQWSKKRKQYLESRQAFHEELYQFTRMLLKSIKNDLASGKKVDSGRLYALGKLLPMITKIKDYEDVVRQHAEEDKGPEDLRDVIRQALGEVLG